MKPWIGLLVALMVAVLALVACAPEAQPAEEVEAVVASGALDTSYDGALDATGQLALGTLMLEETGAAVSPDQAETLLPLWQVLQGGTTRGDAETQALFAQIEKTMTAGQLAAIAGMQLTQDDLRAWMEEQGMGAAGGGDAHPSAEGREPSAGFEEGGEMPPDMATRQAERADMSDEEREAMRAELKASGAVPEGAPSGQGGGAVGSRAVLGPLVELLSERAAGAAVSASELPTPAEGSEAQRRETQPTSGTMVLEDTQSAVALEQAAVVTEDQTQRVAQSVIAPASALAAPAPHAAPAIDEVAEGESAGAAEVVVEQAAAPAGVAAAPASQVTTEVTTFDGSVGGLTRFEDPSPGPPFSIEVSGITVNDASLRITGLVRNDGDQTYEAIGVIGTFYSIRELTDPTGGGRRPPSGSEPPSEASEKEDDHQDKEGMFAYGPIDAQMGCQFLEPGESCVFSLEVQALDYVAYGLHPEGQPAAFFAWHEEGPVTLTGISAANDGVGYVRIRGQVTNENDYPLKSVTVTGTLIDGAGQIVSVASTTVVGEIAPGESRSFDLRVPHQPYARYEVSAQGARY